MHFRPTREFVIPHYWNATTQRGPDVATYTFIDKPTAVVDPRNKEKILSYSGTGVDGQPQSIRATASSQLTDMGESEPPRFSKGQEVLFGQRGVRIVRGIVLTKNGWKYLVPLKVSAGSANAVWKLEISLKSTD